MSQILEETDVNDAFDAIVLSEQRISNEAYENGLLKGAEDGIKEGFHLGYHRGEELGLEIGFYRGVLSVLEPLLNDEGTQPKAFLVSRKLISALDAIPNDNDSDSDILKSVENARSSFKQLMSLLKLPIVAPSTQSSSF